MSERRAVCMPLGYGWAGPPTSITYDGVRYACTPFRIEVGGVRVVPWNDADEPGGYSITDYPGGTEVMLRNDHALGAALRDAVSAPRAEALLAMLEDPAGADPERAPPRWLMREAARACIAREPEPLARMLHVSATRRAPMAFAERRIIASCGGVLLAEVADALALPRRDLHARLCGRWPDLWRLVSVDG